MTDSLLCQPLTLPCGAVLNNRIVKAAMTEGLADPEGVPTEALERLYGLWGEGGAGLLLSGNIIVDADHLERPGNVIIDREPDARMREALTNWAGAATRHGSHFWAQISHAGRQTQKNVNAHPSAPSAIKLDLPGGQFGEPVALTTAEINDIVTRFGICAAAVKDAGFTGVQVHAAHGYLLSQFLSPRTNVRDDEFGGSLENRARLLLEVVATVREAVGPEFPVAVKLNSADFQKGGFAFTDSLQVVQWLEAAGVDLIEISGGTYEQPKLLGVSGLEEEEPQPLKKSTQIREAYFVDFALAMREKISVPLLVTGGFRRRDIMEQALATNGVDAIGIGRPMCVMTDAPARLLQGAAQLPRFENELHMWPAWLSFFNRSKTLQTIGTFGIQYWYYAQLDCLGRTGRADESMSVLNAAMKVMSQQSRWLKARKP